MHMEKYLGIVLSLGLGQLESLLGVSARLFKLTQLLVRLGPVRVVHRLGWL